MGRFDIVFLNLEVKSRFSPVLWNRVFQPCTTRFWVVDRMGVGVEGEWEGRGVYIFFMPGRTIGVDVG